MARAKKTYRVKYRLGGEANTHNTMYYDTFEEAMYRYQCWQMKQNMELDLVIEVCLEAYSRSSECYRRLFESKVYHPADV